MKENTINQRSLFWMVIGIAFSILAPGSGHLLKGMWVRGATWLGSVFLGGALLYYFFPSLEGNYYSLFGLFMALLATGDLIFTGNRKIEEKIEEKEEPKILKPDSSTQN